MTPTEIPDKVREELAHLERILQILNENPEPAATSETEVVAELIRLRDEHRGAKDEDKGALLTMLTQTMSVLDQVRKAREREKVDPDSPYFARLELAEASMSQDVFNAPAKLKICVSSTTLSTL